MKSFLRIWGIFVFLSFFLSGFIYADDQSLDTINFDFEIPEIKKKSYEFRTEIEVSETIKKFDKNNLLFHQKYFDGRDGVVFFQTDFNLKVEGSYRVNIVKFYARLNEDFFYNDDEGWKNNSLTEEAYISLQPCPSITLDAGKKVLKWGKGYAWSPAAFFSRPKDIEDPDITLEGYYVISGDLIKSMDSTLKTIAFTPVVLPISTNINNEWGEERDTILGCKIYFFILDTDLDIIFLTGEKTEDRFGIDFSKNLSVNFELHGEAAIVLDYIKHVTDHKGNLTEKKYDPINFLLGIRYLTDRDTTYICEYYRNSQGYTKDEIKDYFTLIKSGYQDYSDNQSMAKLAKSRQYGGQFYNKQTVMKDYLYLKISQKEPFNILYFTPSIACIYNINDKSASITPQITYAPLTNFELDLKATFLLGKNHTEYGEKLNDYKIYTAMKYYF